MDEILGNINSFINNTQIPQQIREVDAGGLFTNPWFILPFLLFIGYKFYKQDVNTLVLTGLGVGLWLFCGSRFMQGLFVNGEIQIGKILPVAGVFLAAIAVAVYFLFMRSD